MVVAADTEAEGITGVRDKASDPGIDVPPRSAVINTATWQCLLTAEIRGTPEP